MQIEFPCKVLYNLYIQTRWCFTLIEHQEWFAFSQRNSNFFHGSNFCIHSGYLNEQNHKANTWWAQHRSGILGKKNSSISVNTRCRISTLYSKMAVFICILWINSCEPPHKSKEKWMIFNGAFCIGSVEGSNSNWRLKSNALENYVSDFDTFNTPTQI